MVKNQALAQCLAYFDGPVTEIWDVCHGKTPLKTLSAEAALLLLEYCSNFLDNLSKERLQNAFDPEVVHRCITKDPACMDRVRARLKDLELTCSF